MLPNLPFPRGRAAASTVVLGLMLVLLALPTHVCAQVVRGTVVTVGDRAPISDARLLLRDQDGTTRAAALSSETGFFELRSDASGMVRLEVKHLGYANWETANFALASDALIEVEVKLGIEAIPLEPLTVITRRSAGDPRIYALEQRMTDPTITGGYFLTRADLDQRPAATPSALVIGTPGMSVRPAGSSAGLDRSVIMSGDCVARTFIDGVRFDQTGMTSVDDLITPEALEGVEVYPRPRSAPVQYQDLTNPGCGVVLFWTRPPAIDPDSTWGPRRVAVGFGLLLGIVTMSFLR